MGFALESFGQCAIDYSYNPIEFNYGLHPDTLPDGVQGQIYNQDLTFYLPLDTTQDGFYVIFEDFHITSISLPLGLTWQCDNYENTCHYNPSDSQYGCVNVSGVPLQAGEYNVDVELVATHDLSYLVGTEIVSFSLPMTILPDTSTASNEGFAMTNPSGCAPVTVSFTNNNEDMLSYTWDFGNGNVSSLESPVDQVFSEPGEYVVSYSAAVTEASYFLESIVVNSASCSDSWPAGDPDFFYTISGANGVIQEVPLENYYSTDFPYTINLQNAYLLEEGEQITFSLYDDDSDWFSTSYEDCGSLTFTPSLVGGESSVSGGGLGFSYSVLEVPANEINSSDTVFVYDYPEQAILEYDTLSNSLSPITSSFAMQWYHQGNPLPNATSDTINPEYSGWYWLVTINENGCASISDEFLVVICDSSYQPTIQSDGMSAWMLDSALYDDVQWYYEGELLLGQTEPILFAESSGYYYISAIDTFGCSYYSDSVLICDESMQVAVAVAEQSIWVADSLSFFNFYWQQNGNVINGANNALYTASESSYYSVTVEDSFGCSYESGQNLICESSFSPSIYVFENTFWTADSLGFSTQWFLNGVAIPGANTAVHQGVEMGEYTIQLTDEYGCSYMSEVVAYSDVDEQLLAQHVLMYPNPVKDLLEVELAIPNVSVVELEITDLLGRKLCEKRFQNAPYRIKMADLENGVYLVTMRVNGVEFSEKLVKH